MLSHLEAGDGAGSDASQGLGEEFLSNTFSWGDALKDYNIVARDADTVVTVSYWNTSDNDWVVQEYHYMNANNMVARNGNDGPGTDGASGDQDGASTVSPFAGGANLWKFESNNPILVRVNDTAW